MNRNINIAVVGLGQIGIYLYNELNSKKKEIENKTGKKIEIVAISAKNKNKKRRFKIDNKIFYSNPLNIFKEKKIDILFECIGLSDGISKKIAETALKNKVNVITPNKALIAKHGDNLAKIAEKNNVKPIPITNPKYTIFLAAIFPYDLFAKSVIKKAIG